MKKIGWMMIACFILLMVGHKWIGVSAEAPAGISMVQGASIRTSGTQGLRFSATFSESLLDSDQRGFFIIYGAANIQELQSAIGSDMMLNGKEVKVANAYDETTDTISVVLTGIPDAGYAQEITVIGYALNGETYTFVEAGVTRNVADVARAIFNLQPTEYTGDLMTLVDSIVATRRIKVTSATGALSYFADFDAITLAQGDTLRLTRGVYEAQLIVDQDDVTVLGHNTNVDINGSGVRNGALEESIYTGSRIQVSDGVDHFSVNGIHFTNDEAVRAMGSHSGIDIRYCLFETTSNFVIRDHTSDCSVSDLVIKHNYFHPVNEDYSRDVFFWSPIISAEITHNYFKSDLGELNGDDYAIRFMRFADGSHVDIYQNTFDRLGSNYVIDIGFSHGSSNTRETNHAINVNIEDNWITPHYLTCLGGNGIRVMYIGDGSTIYITHNSAFRTSPYYNAILLTTGNTAGAGNSAEGLVVEITHNKFYAEDLALVTKPEGRNVSSRFTRLGLGIPADANMTYHNNYYGSSTSRSAYTLNTSGSATNSTNQSVPTTNQASSGGGADSGYQNMLGDFESDILTYLDEMGTLPSNINAFYGGSDDEDITQYIPSFLEAYTDELEIQDGILTYVGRRIFYARVAVKNGIASAISFFSSMDHHALLVAIALSYHLQGEQIQYDQTTGRRMLYLTPEMASAENYAYLDCSSFVNSVYKTTFGIDVYPGATASTTNTLGMINYARDHIGQSDVIRYVLTEDYPDSTSRAVLLSQIQAQLEIGDIIVYRYQNDAKGHVMLYLGEDSYIHATGRSYDYDAKVDKFDVSGSIQISVISDLFSLSGLRYLFKADYDRFCVIRPMNRSGIMPKINAIERYQLQGIDIEKHASVPNYSTVLLGQDITYFITLTNTGDEALKNFNVYDAIADHLASFDGFAVENPVAGHISGHQITWKISRIEPQETIVLAYTITVTSDSQYVGSVIESQEGFLESIPLNPLYHTIISASIDELELLSTIIDSMVGESGFSTVYALFDSIYSLFATECDTINPLQGFSGLADLYIGDQADARLYGGYDYDRTYLYNQDLRPRQLREDYVCVGDVLVFYEDGVAFAYIFDGETCVSVDSSGYAFRLTEIAVLMDSANGYDHYKIIRPLKAA